MSKEYAKNLARAAVDVKESGKATMLTEGSKRRLEKISGQDKEKAAARAAAAKAKREAARKKGNQIPKKRTAEAVKPANKRRVEYQAPRTTQRHRDAAAKRKEKSMNPATREVMGWKKTRDEKVGKVKSLLNAFGLGK